MSKSSTLLHHPLARGTYVRVACWGIVRITDRWRERYGDGRDWAYGGHNPNGDGSQVCFGAYEIVSVTDKDGVCTRCQSMDCVCE
jgi:hypothetical protein